MTLSEKKEPHSDSKEEMSRIESSENDKKDLDEIELHQEAEQRENNAEGSNCADETVELESSQNHAEVNQENEANAEALNNKSNSRSIKFDFLRKIFRRGNITSNAKESGLLLQEKQCAEPDKHNESALDSTEPKPSETTTCGEDEKGSSNTTDVTIPVSNENDGENCKRQSKMFTSQFGSTKWRWILTGTVLFLIILSLVGFLIAKLTYFPPDLLTINDDPLAFTECGQVWGTKTDDGTYIFQGIPYAVPPKGILRWKPPVPLSTIEHCWTGTYMAINKTRFCMQKSFYERDPDEFDEDCLYLNVYTPTLDYSRPVPVVVYIHGNSLQERDPNDFEWQPEPSLAKDRNTVFVTFNYRLNVFGFMALDVLEKAVRPNTSGNYGFQDQFAVLKWVQKNIHFFGGNPNKVTILAHGSGATSAVALLSSKLKGSLFQQVWMTGGSVSFPKKSIYDIEIENEEFIKNTNCDSVECLYEKSANDLYEALPEWWSADKNMQFPNVSEKENPAISVVDGSVLFEPPIETWRKRASLFTNPEAMMDSLLPEEIQRFVQKNITVVIGSTAQASAFYFNDRMNNLDWKEYLKDLNLNVTDEIIQFYSNISNDVDIQQQTLISDIRITCPLQEMAKLISLATEDQSYFYIVDYIPSKALNASYKGLPSQAMTAMSTHGLDILAILNKLNQYIEPLTIQDEAFQSNVRDMFFNFVHHGVPTSSKWELRNASHFVNLIGNTIEFQNAPYKNCKLWDLEQVLKFARQN